MRDPLYWLAQQGAVPWRNGNTDKVKRKYRKLHRLGHRLEEEVRRQLTAEGWRVDGSIWRSDEVRAAGKHLQLREHQNQIRHKIVSIGLKSFHAPY